MAETLNLESKAAEEFWADNDKALTMLSHNLKRYISENDQDKIKLMVAGLHTLSMTAFSAAVWELDLEERIMAKLE